MESGLYLLVLLISLSGLLVLDHRFSLAYFYDRKATIIALAAGVLLFLIWDILGILLGIFFIGDTRYLSGVRLAPELPIEEFFFLTLLCYSALLLWRGAQKLWPRI